MPRAEILVLCLLALSTSADISLNTVRDWSQQLGRFLWDYGVHNTWIAELKQKLNAVRYEFKSKDDHTLVEEIQRSIYNMTRVKISAVKRIVKNAEASALRFYYTNKSALVKKDLPYFGTKYTEPDGKPLPFVHRLDVSLNQHFRGEGVNLTHSSVHVPTNVNNRAPHILQVIKWTEELEKIFKSNYELYPSLSWQYFGSYTGVMRQYPGISWNFTKTDVVDMFDCRMRLWYVEASTSPKDVVILVDNSGSMIGMRQEIARHLVNNILETLGSNDFVTVLKFSKEVEAVVECFNDTLVQANLGNVRDLKLGMKSILAEEQANFELGLTAAFELLQKNHNESLGACCNRAIMLITDGVPETYKKIFDKYNGEAAMGVRMFMYLIGEEDPIAKEMEWIACKNNGYYVPLKTASEVREKVLRYMPVVSRPLVLAGERPINWSPLYADIADPRLTDWLWMQRENEEQSEVSSYCYFPKKWLTQTYNATGKVYRNCSEEPQIKRTKTAQILGVAGTDVPIEEIKKLLLPHRIGVNGYAFIITNNGHMIVHPDLRAEFLGILKPHYNSVDLTEVEFMDDDSFETRTMNDELLEIRRAMIEQEYGKKTLKMKYHSDKMRRVSTVLRNFHHIGIKETPYTLGVAVPSLYGLWSIHVSPLKYSLFMAKTPARNVAKEYNSLMLVLQEFIKDTSWSIHPEWMYCKYHYDTEHEFLSHEDELRHFLEHRGTQCTADQHLTPPELLHQSYEKVSKNACYCDRDLLSSLMSDILETRFWIKRNFIPKKRTSLIFLATYSGLTRWIPVISDLETRYFMGNFTKATDEVWYQRAAELWTKEGTFVYSVPFADEFGDDLTATTAIFIDVKKVPVAVVGYRMEFSQFFDEFMRITRQVCSTPGCTTCLSDDISCYMLDNNGYVIVSEYMDERGKLFGEIQGYVFNMMIEEQIFRKLRIYDYQAICLREEEGSNRGPLVFTVYSEMFQPLQHAVQLIEWFIGTAIWLFMQTSVWLHSSSNAAKVKPTQLPRADVKINRTHLEPCVKQIDLYHLEMNSTSYPNPSFIGSNCRNPKPKQSPKPFIVHKIPNSNLVLVVVDMLCIDNMWDEVRAIRTEVDDTIIVGCMNALNANLTRKRPKVCVGKAPKGDKDDLISKFIQSGHLVDRKANSSVDIS